MRKEKTEHSARLPFAASMLIFGTIGLLRRFIDLPSGVIACFRGLLGCVLLLLLQQLGGKKPVQRMVTQQVTRLGFWLNQYFALAFLAL